MCEFLSWIEMPNGELKYISNFELDTREGKKLKKELGYFFHHEIKGHGAIKTYFGIRHGRGIERECTDFSTPDNFPAEIVKKIKNGEFSQIGLNVGLLNDAALAEYKKIEQPAWTEYKKIKQAAWTEYKKIKQAALAEYKKIEQPAWTEYKKIKQAAWTEYEKIKQVAWTEYEKIKQPAWTEYEETSLQQFWKLFAIPSNRSDAWK